MWTDADVEIELDDADDDVVFLNIDTPVGRIDLCGEMRWDGRVLHIWNAHIQGLRPGTLGRRGLNAIGRKLMEVADVDKIFIQGANRTTGCRQGQVPRRIEFPKD